ncbi:MAG: hypothetical protein JWP67_525, partial [Mucilaginibacter sp.]|nr:hypothetical protein [Mucilaginibacter sp.]
MPFHISDCALVTYLLNKVKRLLYKAFNFNIVNLKRHIMNLFQRLFVFILCSTAFACTNPKQKHSNFSKDKVSIVSNNVRIDYTDTGSGDTTLLFVHGWCINKSYWADQIAHFSKGYRVVAIDLPGFGKSGKNRKVWNTTAFGEDIKNVITQLDLKNV